MRSLKKIPDESIGQAEPEPCPLCSGKLWAVYGNVNANSVQYYTTSLCAFCRFEIPIRHSGGYSVKMLQDAILAYLDEDISEKQRIFVRNFLSFIDLFD